MAEAEKPAEGAPEAAPAEPVRPIIRKIIVEDGHAGAHGGAWKIALADMMTAMMAFFLLMWLLGASTEDKKRSVAEYFRPASHSQIVFGELAGSNGMFGGKSIIDPEDGFPFTAKQTALLERLTPQSEGGPNADNGSSQEERNREGPQDDAPSGAGGSSSKQQDKENYDKLEKDIKQKLQENKQLQGMKDQVNIVREKDGLRIEVIDKADYSMFSSGTADMNGKAANLIKEVAKSLKDMPNKVSVRGHTDSQGFAPDSLRNNWSLSSERADSTRQILQGAGISANRFKSIEGVADTAPYVPNNPADPRNRRVSITVLNQ
jgi:chemotaxis protein MotB